VNRDARNIVAALDVRPEYARSPREEAAAAIIGIGSEDVSRFPHLLGELFYRGWSEQAVGGIAGLIFSAYSERSRRRANGCVR
jgi:hypothetical protein